MLESAVDHLIYNTLPSATDYSAAEEALTSAYERCPQSGRWEAEARLAKRRAAKLAIAIDGLADRCKTDLALSLTQIRGDVAALCAWPERAQFARAVLNVFEVLRTPTSTKTSAIRLCLSCPMQRSLTSSEQGRMINKNKGGMRLAN